MRRARAAAAATLSKSMHHGALSELVLEPGVRRQGRHGQDEAHAKYFSHEDNYMETFFFYVG